MTFYSNAPIVLSASPQGAKLFYVCKGESASAPHGEITVSGGQYTFTISDTDSYTITKAETVYWQEKNSGGAVIGAGEFLLLPGMTSTYSSDKDYRSPARIALDAIEAKMAGRALTVTEAAVSIGGKSITYINSIAVLKEWRNHYLELVAREQGKSSPKAEYLTFRRS